MRETRELQQHRRSRFRSALLAAAAVLCALTAYPNGAAAIDCPRKPYNQTLEPTQPRNLGELKRQILDYKCFGGYDRDVARVLADARRYVDVRAPQVKKAAIVLDIDETALSNWRQLLANDFGYIIEGDCSLRQNFSCATQAWEQMAKAEVIKPTLDLFNLAKRKGVAIFFVTGRIDNEQERIATEANLRQAGYEGWTALIMMPAGKSFASAADYKSAERAKIEKLGYRIIVNVGDQSSDLRGGHAERRYRLPNPFYFIP